MMLKRYALGLISLCLMILSGCASGGEAPVPPLMVQSCPKVRACHLTAVSPKTNGELNLALEQAYADWAHCAAQIDMVVGCQNAEAR